MRQIGARWPGNPMPLHRILDVFGPNLLRGRIAINTPSAVDIFGWVPINAQPDMSGTGVQYVVIAVMPAETQAPVQAGPPLRARSIQRIPSRSQIGSDLRRHNRRREPRT